MNVKKNNKKAFTLPEMLIMLLVLSLITLATLPVITLRSKVVGSGSGSDYWQYVTPSAKSDIYFERGAAIGANNLGGNGTRLFVNTPLAGTTPHVILNEGSTEVGQLKFDSTNIGLGKGVLATGSGANNTVVGSGALSTYSASNTTVVGYQALMTNAGGEDCTAIGSNALRDGCVTPPLSPWGVTKLISSTAIGYKAAGIPSQGTYYGADTSVAIGASSYSANYVANSNTAVGYNVLSKIASGGGNTAVGFQALKVLKGPSSNTAVGALACSDTVFDFSNTCLGSGSSIAGYDNIDYGIAIGAKAKVIMRNSTAIGYNAKATEQPLNLKGGSIVLGGEDPTASPVFPTVIIPGSLTVRGLNGALSASNGDVSGSSDRRLKNIKGESTAGLEQIKKLKVYNFTFKKDKKKTPMVGVIAQDLKKVFPDAVTKGDGGYLMIRQDDMFYAMVNSIKQLDKIIQNLSNKVQSVVAKVQALEDKIAAVIKTEQLHSKELKQLEQENIALVARLAKLQDSSR